MDDEHLTVRARELAGEISAAEAHLAAVVEQVTAMDDEHLTVRARELAGEISAAEAHLAAVVAEIERRGIHADWECRDIERFAGWHLQQSPTRARALADVGRALAELPVVAEAVADGTLSFDKARSIVRVAAPDTEGALVQLALHATVAQTQRICGQWRKAERHDTADPDTPGTDGERPTVMVFKDEDGIELTVRFDHVRGELVLASIDAGARAIRAEREDAAVVEPGTENDRRGPAGCDEDRPVEKLTTAEWRALGLLRLAEGSLIEVPEGLQRSGFDTTVVVHVGIDTLCGPDLPVGATDSHGTTASPDSPGSADTRRGASDADGRSPRHRRRDEMSELEPAGVAVRRDIARWLACDAGLLTVIEDQDGNPLHLGRRRNPIPPAIRRAVMARYRTCAWPGCTATAVQLHHIHHRVAGGHDDVESIVPECAEHHRLVHLRHIAVTVDDDGTPHHWRPDRTEIIAVPRHGRAPGADALTAPDRLAVRRLDLGADPAETGRQPRWEGDPLHLADCLAAIQSRRLQALRRTIPTGAPPPSLN